MAGGAGRIGGLRIHSVNSSDFIGLFQHFSGKRPNNLRKRVKLTAKVVGRQEIKLLLSLEPLIIIAMKELYFEVSEDDVDGGFTASALGCGIHTQGDTTDELRRNIREAVDCYFENSEDVPRIIRLHFVRDEVLAV